ncbi:GHKL domain-containing protein [Clostridium beijerinckii]|uniref:Two-component system sensor histidine kinase AgrC n=1 Tax=Clostridium beijerinckii TaxID=1520 RepID=A0AAE5H238_CLOBE|nr:GHKL domain-containing protein [Clostridium beijerinckii]NSB13328.1 two-component system sensor histidine kinase AgrC [Clostridium beijerinckii]OOM30882.1 sensory histidine kinase DcuS [Clostridium beijerinckii]
MLSSVIINGMNTFSIIYLWATLTKKNNNMIKLVSSVLVASILVTVIEVLQLNFIIEYIAVILSIKIIYRLDLKQVILGFFLALVIVMSLELLLSLIVNKLGCENMYTAIIVESIILVIIVYSKIKVSNRSITVEIVDNIVLIYFILTCSVYAIIFKIVWDYDNEIILSNFFFVSLVFCILVIAQVLIYLYFVKEIREKEALKVTNEYNNVIDEIVQEIKQRQHDFVNYKNSIRGMVEVLNEKDLREAIRNYMKDEDIYDTKINELIYIDNVVIRSIVYRNMCKAKKHNITFKYEIGNNVLDHMLSYNELSNVLNNLLNNAFDEVIKEECHKKYIEIMIFNENKESHLVVKNQVVNTSDINLNEIFMRGYSTKNIDTRGYGLYNVQQIVNLHKGYIKINIECNEIIFDIYFNNSSG